MGGVRNSLLGTSNEPAKLDTEREVVLEGQISMCGNGEGARHKGGGRRNICLKTGGIIPRKPVRSAHKGHRTIRAVGPFRQGTLHTPNGKSHGTEVEGEKILKSTPS